MKIVFRIKLLLLLLIPVLATLAQPSKFWKNTPAVKTTFTKKAKAGSPNVLWILLDDVGFGATSAFVGLIQTRAENAAGREVDSQKMLL